MNTNARINDASSKIGDVMVMMIVEIILTSCLVNQVLQVDFNDIQFLVYSLYEWTFYFLLKDHHAVTTSSSVNRKISASRALSTATWNWIVKIEVTKSVAPNQLFSYHHHRWSWSIWAQLLSLIAQLSASQPQRLCGASIGVTFHLNVPWPQKLATECWLALMLNWSTKELTAVKLSTQK